MSCSCRRLVTNQGVQHPSIFLAEVRVVGQVLPLQGGPRGHPEVHGPSRGRVPQSHQCPTARPSPVGSGSLCDPSLWLQTAGPWEVNCTSTRTVVKKKIKMAARQTKPFLAPWRYRPKGMGPASPSKDTRMADEEGGSWHCPAAGWGTQVETLRHPLER